MSGSGREREKEKEKEPEAGMDGAPDEVALPRGDISIEGAAEHSIWIRATVFRPVTVFMLFLALLVLGISSFPRIRTEMLPEGLSTGECGVYIPLQDSTPREAMEGIVKPCEDLLRTLPGLKSIISSSGSRRCFIRLRFDPRYDMSVMVAEVRDRVERSRATWPDSADRYHIWRRGDSDVPAYIVSLGIEIAEEHEDNVDLDYVFDEVIRKRIERLQGVASVRVWGVREKQLEIQLDRERVDAYGIDLGRLVERLAADNTSVTVGRVREAGREFSVRMDARFQAIEEILDFPVDEKFRIGDIAQVVYEKPVRDRLARVNGELSHVLVVSKESGANAVEVCDRVEREIDRLADTLGRTIPGVGKIEAHAWLDQGRMIRASVSSLAESGFFGGICAVIILFLFFRRAGMTLLVTLAIPFSLLITVVWLYFSGGSFNLLSLMGLSLAIGMLVDNSIVVVENIVRQRERDLPPRRAAIEGLREIGLPVALATLTTVMVLLPLFFLEDPRFRKMAASLAGPLCVSVGASLLVALVFIPQGAVLLQGSGTAGRRQERQKGERFSAVNRWCAAALAWCLRHRVEALVAAGLLLGSTVSAFRWLPKADLDMDGPRGIELRLELPRNFTLREANDTFDTVEKAVRGAAKEAGIEIEAVTAWFDTGGGEMDVFFPPGNEVEEDDFFAAIKPSLPELPGVAYHLGYESFSHDKGRQRLRVYIQGNDYERLEEAEEIVRRTLEDKEVFPNLRSVARWSEDTREEVRIEVERQAAQRMGVDTATVSRMVSWALRGAPLPDYVSGEREYPFWIAYDDADKESVDELDSILVHRPGGTPVRLENLSSYTLAPGSGDIHRRNGKLSTGLSVGVEGEIDPSLRRRVERRLRRLDLPRGCEISMRPPRGGFDEDMQSTVAAVWMALSLVFFVMGLLFESWLLPLSVIFCIPFAFFGSVWLILATRVPLDMVGMIGMLMLIGIVVNNAIVLVDYINRLRREGFTRRQAVLRAVRVRFRPIWMTALTTVFGLLPLALSSPPADGVDYRALAVVIIGGLTTSTFFTLFIVPLLYTILDDAQRVARAVVRG